MWPKSLLEIKGFWSIWQGWWQFLQVAAGFRNHTREQLQFIPKYAGGGKKSQLVLTLSATLIPFSLWENKRKTKCFQTIFCTVMLFSRYFKWYYTVLTWIKQHTVANYIYKENYKYIFMCYIAIFSCCILQINRDYVVVMIHKFYTVHVNYYRLVT